MSKTYFSKLNYSLANEDTSLEYAMVAKLKPKRTLAVCGSGGRSLPLATGTSSELVCADLSEQQLLLAKHRTATFLELDHRDFLLYWGFPPYDSRENRHVRRAIFESLSLDEPTRAYFRTLFEELDWHGLIYEGKWEKTFTGVPKLLRRFIGTKYDHIFDFQTMEEQKAFFDRELESATWKLIPRLVLRAFGNAAFFNAFLYKGHFVKKNVEETHFEYYRQAYRRLLYQDLARKNFFLQLTFLGRIKYPEGNTIEAHKDVFEATKAALGKISVKYEKQDLITLGESSAEKFDFVSLSDVPSYFSEHLDRVYLQRLKTGLNPGAQVVVRCYLRVPENTDLTGFREVSDSWRAEIDAEKTQIYKTFIYEYLG